MIYLDDLKYLKIYKKQFFAPINKKDKKHGSAILLLTDKYEDSKWLMNNPFMINRNLTYQSYYLEKDILYTINNENYLEREYTDVFTEAALFTETSDIRITESSMLEDCDINDFYCRLGDKFIFFNEMYNEEVYNEVAKLNQKYKRFLYFDRIRNNKQMLELYNRVHICQLHRVIL